MFTSGERKFTIFDIFFIIILLLSITQIIFSGILRHLVKSKLENYKNSITEEKDIPILALESIKFTEEKSKPRYYPGISNLGFAGELILDCYSGLCKEAQKGYEYECSEDSEGDTYCYYQYKEFLDYAYKMDSKCSFECFELKGKECNNCIDSSKYKDSKGICSINTNASYSYGKYCLSNNVIYIWKGKKYIPKLIKRDYSYLNNAILKNEECPTKTKNCGIIDDNENKLCIPDNLECPINIISEIKINNNNSSFKVGNKTFYYGYDENSINKKIISGLYADTDIYLNNNNRDNDILDTYTISGLLEENKKLYKGLNLGFDPYKEKDIDKKGKSYLKIKYNENVDLFFMRERKIFILKRKIFKII